MCCNLQNIVLTATLRAVSASHTAVRVGTAKLTAPPKFSADYPTTLCSVWLQNVYTACLCVSHSCPFLFNLNNVFFSITCYLIAGSFRSLPSLDCTCILELTPLSCNLHQWMGGWWPEHHIKIWVQGLREYDPNYSRNVAEFDAGLIAHGVPL